MDVPGTVLKGDNRSHFSCVHWEYLLLPNNRLDVLFKSIQHLFNKIQLLEKSFNTEEQCQIMNFNKTLNRFNNFNDTSTIIHATI